jgi:hypothetical protein
MVVRRCEEDVKRSRSRGWCGKATSNIRLGKWEEDALGKKKVVGLGAKKLLSPAKLNFLAGRQKAVKRLERSGAVASMRLFPFSLSAIRYLCLEYQATTSGARFVASSRPPSTVRGSNIPTPDARHAIAPLLFRALESTPRRPSSNQNAHPRVGGLPGQEAYSSSHVRRSRLRRHHAPEAGPGRHPPGAMGQGHDGTARA